MRANVHMGVMRGFVTMTMIVAGAALVTMTPGASPAGAAVVPVAGPGGYVALAAPARILDTRQPIGVPTIKPIAADTALPLQVGTVAGIPSGAGAVALDVTVMNPGKAGQINVYPDGTTRPTASNVNFSPGQTVTNMAITTMSRAGKVDFYNGAGASVNLIVDVLGYYQPGTPTDPGALVAVTPSRVLDTRVGTGTAGSTRPVPAKASIKLNLAGAGGVPRSGAAAAVLNVTVAVPQAGGTITVWGAGTRPAISNLNFVAGQIVSDLVIAPLDANGNVNFYNASAGTVGLIADISGYILSGAPADSGTLASVAPVRLLDTRNASSGYPSKGVPGGSAATLTVAGAGGVPSTGVAAVELRVTVTQPAAAGYVTAFANGTSRPSTTNVSYTANQTVPNLVIVPLSADGKVSLFTSATTHLIVDVDGYVLGTPQASWAAQKPSNPADADTTNPVAYDGISCPASGSCVAIGYYERTATGNAAALIATLSSGSWTVVPAPLPAGADPTKPYGLTAVDCPTAGNCFAVGDYTDTTTATKPLIETLQGGHWLAGSAPLPSGASGAADASAELFSLSCVSATSCTAAGNSTDTAGSVDGFVTTLAGGSWGAATELPTPAGDTYTVVYPTQISCAGTTCVVIASSDATQANGWLVATQAAGAWTAIAPATPTGGAGVFSLSGVSCAATGSCLVAGAYEDNLDVNHGLTESLSGSTWTPGSVSTDSTGDPVENLTAVDCPSTTFCALSGNITGTLAPVGVTVSGSTTTASKLPLPIDNKSGGEIYALSCPAAGSCTAVGTYYAASGPRAAAVSLLNGAWSVSAMALPSGAAPIETTSFAVSCAPSTTFCGAVGGLTDSAGAGAGLLESIGM